MEHEHTGIRAPWTGFTYVASGLAFVAVGVVGRGWRALLCAAAPAVGAVLATSWVVGADDQEIPAASQTCDPGCIPLEAAAGAAAVAAALLAALGIAVRHLARRR